MVSIGLVHAGDRHGVVPLPVYNDGWHCWLVQQCVFWHVKGAMKLTISHTARDRELRERTAVLFKGDGPPSLYMGAKRFRRG